MGGGARAGMINVQLDHYVLIRYTTIMKTFQVAEIRAQFSSVLKEVEAGSEIGITFGKKKETIAVIVPIDQYKKMKERKLGTLEGKAKIRISEDWTISDEELLNS